MSDKPQGPGVPSVPTTGGQNERESALQQAYAKLASIAKELVTLRVITLVGAPRVQSDEEEPLGVAITFQEDGIAADGQTLSIVSTYDLLQGDILTTIHPTLLAPEYEIVRTMHAEREAKAFQTVKTNIETLVKLIEALRRPGGVG